MLQIKDHLILNLVLSNLLLYYIWASLLFPVHIVFALQRSPPYKTATVHCKKIKKAENLKQKKFKYTCTNSYKNNSNILSKQFDILLIYVFRGAF